MEVVEVHIKNPHDRDAIIKEVGEAVAKVLDKVGTGAEAQKSYPEELKSDVDNMDLETMEAVCASIEFETFNNELRAKINDLNQFVIDHQKEWNCALIVSAVAIRGKGGCGGGVTYVGRNDAMDSAIELILSKEDLCAKIEHTQMKARAIGYLESMKDECDNNNNEPLPGKDS